MDSYLKDLLGDTASPLVDIVDDNVGSSVWHGQAEHFLSLNGNRGRGSRGCKMELVHTQRSKTDRIPDQQGDRPEGGITTRKHSPRLCPRNPALEHKRNRWKSMLGHSSTTIPHIDSVLGKPDRNFSNLFGSETTRSRGSQELNDEVASREQHHQSCESPETPGEDSDRLGSPYIMALKSSPPSKFSESRASSVGGPPEKPERRLSDDSMSLVLALEALAASPMSSSSDLSLQSKGRTSSAGEMLYLTQGVGSVPPFSSLASSPHLELPLSLRDLPYDSKKDSSSKQKKDQYREVTGTFMIETLQK